MHVLWFDLLFCKTERAHLHHRNPECAGQNVWYHKSCAHNFKTERVHLHHCIPLRWGTESSIFWYSFFFQNHKSDWHTGLRQDPCTCTTAYPRCAGQNCQFLWSKRRLTIVSRTSGVCGGAGAPALFTLCDNLICGIKKNIHCVPHLRGMQWCRCTRSVLKPCAHDLWYTKKNWRLCPAHGGYAVVQVHLLCFKAVWQPFLYRTSEPSADGRRSTCTTGSPSGHSDRGPLEVHKVWKSLTCSCNSCFG